MRGEEGCNCGKQGGGEEEKRGCKEEKKGVMKGVLGAVNTKSLPLTQEIDDPHIHFNVTAILSSSHHSEGCLWSAGFRLHCRQIEHAGITGNIKSARDVYQLKCFG